MVNDGLSLLVYFVIFSVDYVYSEDFKTGTNHTFRPSIQGPIERIDWRYNGNLVVDWDSGSDPTWFRLKERASLDIKTGDLTLQLKKEDSGLFKGQFQVNGILHYFERTITVIDPVPKPKVTCEQNGVNITLRCSVDPSVQAEFTWSGPNGLSQSGNSLHITKESEERVYFCTAKNKVSNSETEFSLKSCPPQAEDDEKDAFPIGAIVGVLIVLVLIGLVFVGVFWKKIKVYLPAGFPGGTAGRRK
ncbi:lymphocyte function-associated antigen 3 isoform X2 [Ictalurus punctatus]|uniref:Lymphocyte function-associated antigen 3 isoform X2 n=1 Tax=Ictalurus punctatus TaxID=7998 RepID=A0A2D0R5K0_ICTPU|nr:lymphocyte function-associated antigen 3 isoform X2 [Ictalurus punctatus]